MKITHMTPEAPVANRVIFKNAKFTMRNANPQDVYRPNEVGTAGGDVVSWEP